MTGDGLVPRRGSPLPASGGQCSHMGGTGCPFLLRSSARPLHPGLGLWTRLYAQSLPDRPLPLLSAAASRMITNSLNRDSPPSTPPRRPDTSTSKISVTVSNKMAARSAKASGERTRAGGGGAACEYGSSESIWGACSHVLARSFEGHELWTHRFCGPHFCMSRMRQ